MKKAFKASLVVASALALSAAMVACDGVDDPGTEPEVTTYSVSYAAGAGTGTAPEGGSYVVGATVTLASASGLSYEGHVFDGWSDGSTKYNVGASYTMPDHDVTFTAQWKTDEVGATTYTVTYELNGGTGTAPTQSALEAGATFEVASGAGLSKENHTFGGWNDGTNTYQAGASYTMPASNVTLTAQWTEDDEPDPGPGPVDPETYSVTYKHGAATDGQGNALADIVVSEQEEGNYTVGAPREYYYDDAEHNTHYFAGWKVENAQGNTVYLPGQTYALSGDVTLIAQWVDVDDSVGSMEDVTGEAMIVALTQSIGVLYYPGSTPGEFVWVYFTYTLSESDGSLTVNPVGSSILHGTVDNNGLSMNVVIGDVTYLFSPYYDQAVEYTGSCTLPEDRTGVGDLYEGGETVVGIKLNIGNNKVYFKLEDESYVASRYFVDYSSSAHKPDNYGSDALYYEVQLGNGNRHYYILVKADMSKLYICDVHTDEPLEDGEFTKAGASEPEGQVTVQFNINYNGSGAENPASQTVNSGSHITQPQVVGPTGYTLEGWHVGSEDGELFDFANDVVTRNITLVAKWTQINANPTATFTKPEGATGENPAPIEMVQDTTKFPANPNYTYNKTGWTFQGWAAIDNTTHKPTQTVYAPNTIMYKAQDTVYVAVFGRTYAYSADWQILVYDHGFAFESSNGESGYYPYTIIHDNVIVIDYDGYTMTVRLNDDGSFEPSTDYLGGVSATAQNGTKLVLDGFGTAILGTHTGTYVKTGSSNQLTLTFGDVVVEGVGYDYNDDNQMALSLDTTITIEGTDYVFGTTAPTVSIPNEFIGTFSGVESGGFGLSYKVIITQNSVKVIRNEETPYDATNIVVQHNQDLDIDELVVTVNGEQYTIRTNYSNLVMTGANDFYVSLSPDAGGGGDVTEDPTEIPEDYIGTFIGVDAYAKKSAIVVIESKESIKVQVSGVDSTAVFHELKNENGGVSLYITVDGNDYVFSGSSQIYSFGSSYDSYNTLSASMSKCDPISVWNKEEKPAEDGALYTYVKGKGGNVTLYFPERFILEGTKSNGTTFSVTFVGINLSVLGDTSVQLKPVYISNGAVKIGTSVPSATATDDNTKIDFSSSSYQIQLRRVGTTFYITVFSYNGVGITEIKQLVEEEPTQPTE